MVHCCALDDLVANVLEELRRTHYCEGSQANYRRFYQRLRAYAHDLGIHEFSEGVGRQFLEATYKMTLRQIPHPVPTKFRMAFRCLRCLSDYQQGGALRRRQPQAPPHEPPEGFRAVRQAFTRECERRGYSAVAASTRWNRLRVFVDFLATRGVAPQGITAAHLSQYTASLGRYQPTTAAAMLTVVRTLLRFLYQEGYLTEDLSGAVPRLRSAHHQRVPKLWSTHDVQRLLAAVDRNTPIGKRDYAILLLAARLGLRIGDIRTLPLSALRWDKKTITWVQQKTRRAVTLPLLDDVGWALIDYLQHGRPSTSSPTVFVRHHAPFEPFSESSSVDHVMTVYIRRAGIMVPRGSSGMHSLRHTLATALLAQETPLPVIAEILGHAGTHSTEVYLHVNREALRRCALDPEGVFAYVGPA